MTHSFSFKGVANAFGLVSVCCDSGSVIEFCSARANELAAGVELGGIATIGSALITFDASSVDAGATLYPHLGQAGCVWLAGVQIVIECVSTVITRLLFIFIGSLVWLRLRAGLQCIVAFPNGSEFFERADNSPGPARKYLNRL